MVVDAINLQKYRDGATYRYYSKYSQIDIRIAHFNASYIGTDDDLYVVIENMNLLDSVVVDVYISLLVNSTVSLEELTLFKLLIIAAVIIVIFIAIIIGISIYWYVKHRGYDYIQTGALLLRHTTDIESEFFRII